MKLEGVRTKYVGLLAAAALVLGACGTGSPSSTASAPKPLASAAASPSQAGSSAAAQASAPAASSKPAASTGSTASASGTASWDALVQAAKQEGKLLVSGPPGDEYRAIAVDDFQKTYPGISVEYTAANSNVGIPRILTERKADKYLTDAYVSGQTYTVLQLKPANAVVPLEPQLVLPEVTNPSAWFENHLWWSDASQPFTSEMFVGAVQPIVTYNTKLVNPTEFKSYWDVLDPKWAGKVEATDIRPGIVGGVPSRYIFKAADLGPKWLEQAFSLKGLSISQDQRQLIDRLAQGQFALGLFLSGSEVATAIKQGLPVGIVPSQQFKEAAAVGPNNGTLSIMDRAPHPKAAQVFVNWLLSRQGQMSWQHHLLDPSLRTDILKDELNPLLVPQPGGKYVNAATEEYSRLTFSDISKLVTDALDKGKS